jgi:aminomethyltransferase
MCIFLSNKRVSLYLDIYMRTALCDAHLSLGAKMIDFYGWEMPLQYSGIIDEHISTRFHVGIFDVSHMGRFEIKGDGSTDCLQLLLTNDIGRLVDYRALYSPMCNDNGGIIDDLIVYRKGKNAYILVVNASNRIKDFGWISSHLSTSVAIEDITFSTSLIAVQGPSAKNILGKFIVDSDLANLRSFDIIDTNISGIRCMVSRTGYTGEDGFEIMFGYTSKELWNILIEAGKQYQIKPCGLGSRDTLRLEAGLLLHGKDMDQNTSPLEVPLRWTVKFDKGDFIGKQSLLDKKRERKLVGFEILESKRIARHKNDVFLQNERDNSKEKIGIVTSGGYSPILHKSIGFCFVPSDLAANTAIKIDIGGKLYKARIMDTIRFYTRS